MTRVKAMAHMRNLLFMAAATGVAANAVAQAPLTIDPSFTFQVAPSFGMSDIAGVINAFERNDGTILVAAPNVNIPDQNAPEGGSFLIDLAGDFVPSSFIFVAYGGLTELANGQYLANNRRRNHDGTWDPTWATQPDTLHNFDRGAWHAYSDLSVLMGGSFTYESGETPTICLIKLKDDGQVDSTWPVRRCDPYRELFSMFPLRNGQFLIRGNWDNYEGEPTGPFVRINADGSPDLSFRFDAFRGSVRAVHELPNGKLMMGGQFFMNNQLDTLKLVRLNLDGSLDTTFNNYGDYRTGVSVNSGMIGIVNVITALDEERFVVGGVFDRVNGQARNCICCVDTLGNLLDCWAGGGLVPVSNVNGVAPIMWLAGFKQFSNGDWYMYGKYRGFVDEEGEHPEQVLMSRMFGPTVGLKEEKAPAALRLWPNPGTDLVQLHWPGHAQYTLTLREALGRVVVKQVGSNGSCTIEVGDLASGVYVVQVVSTSGEQTTTKWVKP